MQSQVLALVLAVVAAVTTDGKRLPTDLDGPYVYNQRKIHKRQDNQASEHHASEELCPNYVDIAPCVCRDSDYGLELDCSAIESEDQLRQVFLADFPTKTFTQFTIDSNSNLKKLESHVFNNVSFESIDIEYSALEVIETQALDSCYETADDITLANNRITSFPFDEISRFSKLEYFDVQMNLLSLIPANAFNGLMSLETLILIQPNITSNIIGTFENLPSLKDIYLEYNNLTVIPTNFIKSGSSNLDVIDLLHNNIVSVAPGAFDILEGYEGGIIALWDNSLTTLEEATWRPYLEAGTTLDAEGNPLECGCDIAWLFGEDHLLEQIDSYTTCSDGQEIYDLDPSIFENC